MANVYEQFFVLKHYGSWSLIELYNLPVGLRKWWLDRTIKEYEKEKEEHEKAMRQAKTRSRGVPKKSMPRFR
jgi:hypothetical protein